MLQHILCCSIPCGFYTRVKLSTNFVISFVPLIPLSRAAPGMGPLSSESSMVVAILINTCWGGGEGVRPLKKCESRSSFKECPYSLILLKHIGRVTPLAWIDNPWTEMSRIKLYKIHSCRPFLNVKTWTWLSYQQLHHTCYLRLPSCYPNRTTSCCPRLTTADQP